MYIHPRIGISPISIYHPDLSISCSLLTVAPRMGKQIPMDTITERNMPNDCDKYVPELLISPNITENK